VKEQSEDNKAVVVRAEQGEDFQEYVYADGAPVPHGTPVGIEYGDEFVLFPHILYKN